MVVRMVMMISYFCFELCLLDLSFDLFLALFGLLLGGALFGLCGVSIRLAYVRLLY